MRGFVARAVFAPQRAFQYRVLHGAFLLERARGRSNDRREEAGGRAFRCREKSSVGKTHCERLQLLCLVFYIFLCKVTCNRHRLATLTWVLQLGATSDFSAFARSVSQFHG